MGCYIPTIKALDLLISDKKIFKEFISKIYFSLCDLARQRTKTINNFVRGPPKDHLCEIFSKIELGFRRSCHFSQLLTYRRRRTTKTDHQSSPCHYVTGKLLKN